MRASLAYLNWIGLRGWGRHRLVRIAIWWVFLVPILGGLLAPLSGASAYLVVGESTRVELRLPFHWVVFFFMVLAFALGRGLYVLYCPDLVKRFSCFNDYRACHLGMARLLQLIDDVVRRLPVRDLDRFHYLMKAALQPDPDEALAADEVFEQTVTLPSSDNRLRLAGWYRQRLLQVGDEAIANDVFDVLHEQAGRLHRYTMVVCSLCFRMGLLLLVLVMAQSFLFMYQLIGARHISFWSLLFNS